MSDFAVSTFGGAGPVQPRLASFLPDWLNPQVFLADPALAPWVVLLVCGIIFAETGLLIGFFLPGDSMLFTAGLLVATGTIKFNIVAFAALIIVAAIIGNQAGYLIGSKAGPAIFNRENSKLFKRENVESAHAFFEKHGGKALILARFVPIIRTFVPVIVGVAQMNKRQFFVFNVIGAVLWGGGVTLLGYLLGDTVPWVRENLDIIFIAIVLVSVIPIGIEVIRGLTARRQAEKYGTGVVAEFIEEHEPEEERKTP
ncbi:VTT domain-containing protein [Arthrobacter sp. AL08]|uniref:VTT domain-containing protein n=1 Tax=Micrococcaceae TaxID=1268 RepID=UPI001CFFF532|nr:MULTISPECIES: VTT domain-containing protein [Micrococcaceae]MDD1477162.1 VTT domain-containing protein [Arthrobacter sp. H16F315]MDI3242565.1 VTT domain-containing protein [Arthrobacter sp. AL05]MDI3278704.1 VTT domain-containing protein [Arthrobacter sp. AL08]MDJ0351280.1 VTT domain-containing protein [Pseudarthrobacter sp. PH31-O2]WGZ81390.1 VTT domain-containing protein [Arthrobacter sp. EM1]